MSTITIDTSNLRGHAAPLYRILPCEQEPQRAFVEMEADGDVSACYDPIVRGGGMPEAVWNNRTLRWSVSCEVQGDALADVLESAEVLALLQTVHDGHTVEFDGRVFRGTLTDDAQDASDELERIFGSLKDRDDDAIEAVRAERGL